MADRSDVWAHSVNVLGRRHLLTDHVRATAHVAARFAAPFGGDQVAWWLGLLHDAGKASCVWQDGLGRAETIGGRVGVDHKRLGTRLALARGLGHFAMAIQGHHGGLDTATGLQQWLEMTKGAVPDLAETERVVRRLLPELANDGSVEFPDPWRSQPLVAEMAVRLVFSALCDADFLDTAAHFEGSAAPRLRAEEDFSAMRDRFEAARRTWRSGRVAGPVDTVREDVYDRCVIAAKTPPGVFRLAAPTGSGKTLAAAGFGLHHAAMHGMRRVIVAVPFLTITEQNAAVYRQLLEDGVGGVVLEHHSGVRLDTDSPARRWERLAAENWDAPFVVTTTVRLFEALFDRRPAAMRRVHRLAGAVLVLDEVQSLPHDMLVPILDALKTLVAHFGTTVLLASATQPDFWHLSPFRTLPAVDIVADQQQLVPRLRRVRFEWRIDPSPTLAEVAREATECSSALVVVNTTRDAQTVFDHWRTARPGASWHLSTRMCPAHRWRVLDAVRARLAAGERTLLVATQLIEAGVDVDFPVVFRTLAPADSLLQAAGRANREGRLPEGGRVVIVDPPDAGQPPAYRPLVGATRVYFGPGKADPDDPSALRSYYRAVYGSLNLEDVSHVGQRIQAARCRFDFRAVADGPRDAVTQRVDRASAFRMIRDDGFTVITPDGAADGERGRVTDLIIQLRSSARPEMAVLRQLQPYTTTLHRSVLRRPGVVALLRPVLGEIEEPGALAEWVGGYDLDTGIELDPRTEEFVL